MAKSNPHFQRLKREYVFPIIERKLAELKASCPEADIVNVGIGDVALPLAPTVAKAIASAVHEMTDASSIRGYGPSEGYPFLRKTIAENDYKNLPLQWDEIFISDGINTDIASFTELFHPKSSIAIPDPTYPVYLDSNLMAGRKVLLMPCLEKTRCLPTPPTEQVDVIYLCSPSNPTGVAMTRSELQAFVDYAQEHHAVILYDNAYSAFITSADIPKSVYEIPGSTKVAVEFRSFSKSAGFTGLRCGYTVVPRELIMLQNKKKIPLWELWSKRQSIKSNGVSYPIQRGAESCYSPEGRKETSEQVKTYLTSAKVLREGLQSLGFTCYGGIDSPYIWWKVPVSSSSWNFFDYLLKECQLVAIPGRGFGEHGEGFIRLSAFTPLPKILTALQRIQKIPFRETTP